MPEVLMHSAQQQLSWGLNYLEVLQTYGKKVVQRY